MGGIAAPAPLSVTAWTLFIAASSLYHVLLVAATTGSLSGFPAQDFYFDWNPPGTAIPIPITQQCETLHIVWERTNNGQGRNPSPIAPYQYQAPYYLQIFASTYAVPFIIPAGSGTSFDFQVPFSPGTQYQICMWDSNGSAGCQDIYTVIPNSSATAQNPVTCTNVTLPRPLQVDAVVASGPLPQYGWIPQCTDIQIQAKNGTGPYAITVAPTLHPTLNLTLDSDPVNWTVSLSHGFSFFISVTDSIGNSWAQGPLHSGENNNTACLNVNHSPEGHSSSTVPVTIGASIGCIIFGLLAGGFGIPALKRWRNYRIHSKYAKTPIFDPDSPQDSPQSPRESMVISGTGREYIVEPFTIPAALPQPSPGNPGDPVPRGRKTTHPTTPPVDASPVPGPSNPADQMGEGPARMPNVMPNVYFVHHDGGRAPPMVYNAEGAAVVELPPQYAPGNTGTPPENDASREVDDDRRSLREPGATPRKTQARRSP